MLPLVTPAQPRSSRRRAPGCATVVLVDPNGSDEEARKTLHAHAIDLHTCLDPLHAAATIGLHNVDVVVLHADLGALAMEQFTQIAHGELGLPVLIAYHREHLQALGPAVLAGARPVIDLPYESGQITAAILHVAPAPGPSALVVGDLSVDPGAYSARLNGQPIVLTALEFELLYELASAAGAVITKQQFVQRFWSDRTSPDSAAAAAIKRLRHKLDNHGVGHAIRNVRGIGYRLDSTALTVRHIS